MDADRMTMGLRDPDRGARSAQGRVASVCRRRRRPERRFPTDRLVSFGLAGALRDGIDCGERARRDPSRRRTTGETLWEGASARRSLGARQGTILAGRTVSSTIRPSARRLHERTGADAVDMESGVLARTGRLDGCVRAISDTPSATLGPLASMVDAEGRLAWSGIARSACGRATRSGRSPASGSRSDKLGEVSDDEEGAARGAAVVLRRRRSGDRDRRAAARVARPPDLRPARDRPQRQRRAHGSRASAPSSSTPRTRFRPGEICVLSAHGVAPAVRENCVARGLRVVDAVCPLVSKVHAEARRYADSGHLVALIGHADHVEVIGTKGERPDQIVVVESPEDAEELDTEGKPLAVITQTTLSLDDVASTVAVLEAALRRPQAARCRRHLLRDPEPPGRGEGDRRSRGNLDSRHRLADELERQPARRGGRGGGRGGDARRRRDARSTTASSTGTRSIGLTAGASTPEELVQACSPISPAAATCDGRRGHRRA